ncbi:GTP-binding protein Era [Thecamonas trahens ATCC 50062]|uniref:GTP-binding protein Era n=1 Tax=Thecamonas trahens ATCC 50062 TaxID=461836 RepID=A0A0L0DIZ0_THETB|nr:GTP-binding protein Era [Thecamonas trahens ATCC 50062]KNC51293.1 GTP-binding protein Era [Thecamonas trahens ATCC 50062]|eukprot:XP_013756217.1 GTP-binding protein Era [Thecamonas trahens ATCC 50062]
MGSEVEAVAEAATAEKAGANAARLPRVASKTEDLYTLRALAGEEWDEVEEPEEPRFARVALVGAPNAGKSTLANALVGTKVSIVSPKMQTTRERVLGVATRGAVQAEYLDTPGLLAPSARYAGKKVMRSLLLEAADALAEADAVICVLDAVKRWGSNEHSALAAALRSGRPALAVINKIDYLQPPVAREELAKDADEWRARVLEVAALPAPASPPALDLTFTSAVAGEGVNDVHTWVASHAPLANWKYPSWWKSDASPVAHVEELVREQIYRRLNQEMPYVVEPRVFGWTPLPSGQLRIDVELAVRTKVQARTLIGSRGAVISGIRDRALAEIEDALGADALLYLRVVRKR